MKNPKTTIAGVVIILGAVSTFAGAWILNGMPTPDAWAILTAAITAGAGHIMAADAKPKE